ncbi:head GIN domain-containing protein [Sediminibacterium sp.]|jgi:hypothetical protein|uniref:head GIN domain-containing protein n=1 Tax=Sediminibacterium sp. TaxID=1917865 RepID=UPI0025E8E4A1|nr:head GIN domain-containing protein [Sediminibacterium sp.]MDO8995967.1 head GIN domain-containing protein [Sediminibacterium sp.]MDP1974228.1 head GIN domain-containing protein [Sediminibacterium sp.]MDP2419944.1 head GIN domain-containing protein [Sediminibacterium sp.]
MKSNIFASVLLSMVLVSCNWIGKSIHGDGNIVTENRKVNKAEKIVLKGNFDVVLVPGNTTSVSIETDENLQKYILLSESNDELVFKTKSKFNLKSDHGIKITITTPNLTGIYLAGSGNVRGNGKFTGGNELKIDIAGQGDVDLMVNTPKIEVDIKGSGNVNLQGETKTASFDIAGTGDCNAEMLKSENASIKIAGNGNVKVYADVSLNIKIMGSGDVFYKGNAEVSQKIVGAGNVKKID